MPFQSDILFEKGEKGEKEKNSLLRFLLLMPLEPSLAAVFCNIV